MPVCQAVQFTWWEFQCVRGQAVSPAEFVASPLDHEGELAPGCEEDLELTMQPVVLPILGMVAVVHHLAPAAHIPAVQEHPLLEYLVLPFPPAECGAVLDFALPVGRDERLVHRPELYIDEGHVNPTSCSPWWPGRRRTSSTSRSPSCSFSSSSRSCCTCVASSGSGCPCRGTPPLRIR